MRVFISYSLGLIDQHVARLIAQQAQTRGIEVDSTRYGSHWSETVSAAVQAADFVVAIISGDSHQASIVQSEVKAAVTLGKPVIALVERGSAALSPGVGLRYVEFDRHDPGPALSNIGQILEEHRNKTNLQGWLVAGGLAILALYLFSGDDKR